MTAEAALVGEALRYTRSGTTVLDGVDLTVHVGERLAVVGPSGSGKTTLLAILAGLLAPSAGRVLLFGRPVVAGHPPPKIGLVLQGYGLVSLLTAAENVEIALRAGGATPADARVVAARVLGELELTDQADHLVDELSGGQQQRTALARALAGAPTVLLADEPTAEQDPESRVLVMDRIVAAAAAGAAVVVATHDPEVAQRCDRVVRLDLGMLPLQHQSGVQ